MCANNHFWLNYSATSNLVRFKFWYVFTSLSLSISFFVLPNNLIVSGVKTSSLYSVFILKTILFLILFKYTWTGGFSVKVPCFLMINSK